MDLKEKRTKREEKNARKRPTLGFFDVRNNFAAHSDPTRPMNCTANAMPRCKTQSLRFTFLPPFSFLSFFIWFCSFWRNERPFRGSTVERERYTLQLDKQLSLSPLSSLTGLMAANGQNFLRRAHKFEEKKKRRMGRSLKDI